MNRASSRIGEARWRHHLVWLAVAGAIPLGACDVPPGEIGPAPDAPGPPVPTGEAPVAFSDEAQAAEAVARAAADNGLQDLEVQRDDKGRVIGVALGLETSASRDDQRRFDRMVTSLTHGRGFLLVGGQRVDLRPGPKGSRPKPADVELQTQNLSSGIPGTAESCDPGNPGYCAQGHSEHTNVFGFFRRTGSSTHELSGGVRTEWVLMEWSPFFPGCQCPEGYTYVDPSPSGMSAPTDCRLAPLQAVCRRYVGTNWHIMRQLWFTNDGGGPSIARDEVHTAANTPDLEFYRAYFGSLACPESIFPSCKISGICTSHSVENDGGSVRTTTASGSYDCVQ